ncbi:AAA-ATPase At3g50940-like, partial [Camellia sinensis]|uniref:AAA-ATPase At3g50940-like n=1 Tax=Camellia sinensis TaxID=4442 RepID=UPI0010357450
MKNMLSTVASLAASAMLIRSVANDFLPHEVQDFLSSTFRHLSRHFCSQFTIVIEEFQGLSLNQVFEAVDVYLGTKVTLETQRVRLGKAEEGEKLETNMERNEEMMDVFENVRVKWKMICTPLQSVGLGHLNSSLRSEIRSYELICHKKHKNKVLNSYLPYILERSKIIKEENKAIKLHTSGYGRWDHNTTKFDHPMTFNMLAIDLQLKKELLEDLESFSKG